MKIKYPITFLGLIATSISAVALKYSDIKFENTTVDFISYNNGYLNLKTVSNHTKNPQICTIDQCGTQTFYDIPIELLQSSIIKPNSKGEFIGRSKSSDQLYIFSQGQMNTIQLKNLQERSLKTHNVDDRAYCIETINKNNALKSLTLYYGSKILYKKEYLVPQIFINCTISPKGNSFAIRTQNSNSKKTTCEIYKNSKLFRTIKDNLSDLKAISDDGKTILTFDIENNKYVSYRFSDSKSDYKTISHRQNTIINCDFDFLTKIDLKKPVLAHLYKCSAMHQLVVSQLNQNKLTILCIDSPPSGMMHFYLPKQNIKNEPYLITSRKDNVKKISIVCYGKNFLPALQFFNKRLQPKLDGFISNEKEQLAGMYMDSVTGNIATVLYNNQEKYSRVILVEMER